MKRILVIEDEIHIRDNIQDILELSGFEVLTAENGIVGLQLAKNKLPDLILCDIMMPKLDGYEVLKALRQEIETALIPVIFLTAKAERTDVRQGMELGADDYLTKPFSASELRRAIAVRLERQESLNQQMLHEKQQAHRFKQEVSDSQKKLQESRKLADLKTDLLTQISRDLRDPLSNINMAIHMLRRAKTDEERDRYLNVLQDECAREIKLLQEIDDLRTLLTPENAQLLHRFNLLNRSL